MFSASWLSKIHKIPELLALLKKMKCRPWIDREKRNGNLREERNFLKAETRREEQSKEVHQRYE